MLRSYVAYGLQLRCSFAPAGMPERRAAGLPQLSVRLRAGEQLEQLWSGSREPPLWRGRLGDDRPLTLERGTAGDLLFTYADRARFLLDPERGRLDCAPAACARDALDWQQVLLGKVLGQVAIARGYEALHAAAVDSPAGVLAFAGLSGAGKSTLALELIRRGWPLLADDTVVLERAAAAPSAGRDARAGGAFGVRAHPGTPHMNVAATSRDAALANALGTKIGELSGERWLAVRAPGERPRPVGMVCLLRRGRGLPLALRRLPASPLLLAGHMLGLRGDADRQRSRFELYSELSVSAPILQLTSGLEQPPAGLADLIEAAVSRSRHGAAAANQTPAGRRRRASRVRPVLPAGSVA